MNKNYEKLASELMNITRNTLVMKFRYLDKARRTVKDGI